MTKSEPSSHHHHHGHHHHHHPKHKHSSHGSEVAASSSRYRDQTFTSTSPHIGDEYLVAMPQSWVDCKFIMTIWLIVTFLIFGLSIVTIPIGCILAIGAAFLYFQRRGTTEPYAGKYSAHTIYWICYAAWFYDMIILTLLAVVWIMLVFGKCTDLDNNVCDFRVSVGYFGSAQMCMILVHSVCSFLAYLSVRDCYKSIQLDEREEKERFADLEKQIFAEFRKMRKHELSEPKKKKKHRSSSKIKKSH